jgi:hypothetical protein
MLYLGSQNKIRNERAIPFYGYPKNNLGSISYLLKIEEVLCNLDKTQKECNIHIGVLCKHYGLNYFSLGYHQGIVHA